LQQEGQDVQTTVNEGLTGRSDIEVADAASAEQRILFTLDLEFADLRKYPPGSHPGVILFRPRIDTVGTIAILSRISSAP
jgi:predicted nuclease of predicted toxin-antitoxin system